MNKNESARNYIQFSSCDSLQSRESCRDELYKTSRQRWCDKLDVCLHPSSGDNFLSICQLLQLDRGNNHLEHHRCRSVDVLVLVLHSHQNHPAQEYLLTNTHTCINSSTNNKRIKSQQFRVFAEKRNNTVYANIT